jgi:hypothetical protein
MLVSLCGTACFPRLRGQPEKCRRGRVLPQAGDYNGNRLPAAARLR